jgi:tetratricopeptide (TPR) repeat protein
MWKKIIILSFVSFFAAVSTSYLSKFFYPIALREEIRVVPKKDLVEFLCLDHRGFAADMLFVQVNIHSGSLMWKPLKFVFDSEWSYGIMDLITDLDPKYYIAYLFSGMGLIHRFSDVHRAKPILEKGMKVFPESWELPFWLGYDYYAYFHDYDVAAEYLWLASQKPKAPRGYRAILHQVLREEGAYEKALYILEKMVEETENTARKMAYEKRVVQLKNLIFLESSVSRYRESRGAYPEQLRDIVKVGMIPKLPEDPFGMTYVWDEEKMRVTVK